VLRRTTFDDGEFYGGTCTAPQLSSGTVNMLGQPGNVGAAPAESMGHMWAAGATNQAPIDGRGLEGPSEYISLLFRPTSKQMIDKCEDSSNNSVLILSQGCSRTIVKEFTEMRNGPIRLACAARTRKHVWLVIWLPLSPPGYASGPWSRSIWDPSR
jgi:hypothetical protein